MVKDLDIKMKIIKKYTRCVEIDAELKKEGLRPSVVRGNYKRKEVRRINKMIREMLLEAEVESKAK